MFAVAGEAGLLPPLRVPEKCNYQYMEDNYTYVDENSSSTHIIEYIAVSHKVNVVTHTYWTNRTWPLFNEVPDHFVARYRYPIDKYRYLIERY